MIKVYKDLNRLNKPTVFGIGYLESGDFHCCDRYGRIDEAYVKWYSMIRRCYSSVVHKRQPAYAECEVCEEWLNYQNFAKWYYSHELEDGIKWELDKDLLRSNNKIYSPETCVLIPKDINALLTLRKNDRGKYPLGVCKRVDKKTGTVYYVARVNDRNKRLQGKYRYSVEEAYEDYKKLKREIIAQRIDEFEEVLDDKVIQALRNLNLEER